jgi:phage terminase large subunit-like protein
MYRLTTPGFDIGGVCHQHYEYCKKILSGAVSNETIFVQIYELDPDDDYHDKNKWPKANPGLNITLKITALQAEYEEAVAKGGHVIVDFKTKLMALWVSSASEWIPDIKYMAACTHWNVDNFTGAVCFGGLDMAYSDQGDICAFSAYIPNKEKPGTGYVYTHYWIPETKSKDVSEIDYIAMQENGDITVTPGDTTDYDMVLDFLKDFNNRFQMKRLYFDAWNISYFYEQMVKSNLNVFKFQQSPSHMSPPTKRIGEMVHKKEIDFGNNQVTRWMISNVLIKDVGSGLIKMVREKKRKIDGIVATVMAYAASVDHGLENKEYSPQIIDL